MKYKLDGGYISFNDDGITISNWFSKRDIELSWNDVEFISVTPSLKYINGEWIQYNGEPIFKDTGEINFKVFEVKFSLYNLPDLISKSSWLQTRWMYSRYMIRQLFDENNKPLKQKGILTYSIKPKLVADTLVAWCNLVQTKNRFGLIVTYE